jgi:cell division protein FtsZ
MIRFELAETADRSAKMRVIGVGGGGNNAVDRMVEEDLPGVEFIGLNTDAQALKNCRATVKVQIGKKLTRGLGAGARPEIGRQAIEENKEDVLQVVRGADLVFVTAGLGGGTGTGAAPVVGQLARELGALTIGIITKPFEFEGRKRMHQADIGLAELRKAVDTVIVVPNQRLLSVVGKGTSFREALKRADDEEAISSPLLDDISISGAKAVLINITGGADLTIDEVSTVSTMIRDVAGDEAEIIFGTVHDPSLENEIRVTVIATGFDTADLGVGEPRAVRPGTPLRKPAVRPAASVPAAAQKKVVPLEMTDPRDLEIPTFIRRQMD